MKRVSLALLAAILCVAQIPLASLSGAVYDELGGPIIAAKLSLRSDKSPLYLTKTTEQGTFQFPRIADAGSYTLSIDQAGLLQSGDRGDCGVCGGTEDAAAGDAEGSGGGTELSVAIG